MKVAVIGGLQKHQTPRTDGISPTINAAAGMGGGHTAIGSVYTQASENFQRIMGGGCSKAIKAETHDAGVLFEDMRVRKYTPKECWRLMDFDDDDFDKAKAAGVSNSQLYKQAGNSICVGVLEAIFKQMTRKDL